MSAGWTDAQISRMAEIAYGLPHMWDHAIGPDWTDEITLDRLEVYIPQVVAMSRRRFDVGGIEIGGEELFLISGPA